MNPDTVVIVRSTGPGPPFVSVDGCVYAAVGPARPDAGLQYDGQVANVDGHAGLLSTSCRELASTAVGPRSLPVISPEVVRTISCRRIRDARHRRLGNACSCCDKDSIQSTTSASWELAVWSAVDNVGGPRSSVVRRCRAFCCRRVGQATCRRVRDRLRSSTSAGRAARLFHCLGTFRCRRVGDACCCGRIRDGRRCEPCGSFLLTFWDLSLSSLLRSCPGHSAANDVCGSRGSLFVWFGKLAVISSGTCYSRRPWRARRLASSVATGTQMLGPSGTAYRRRL